MPLQGEGENAVIQYIYGREMAQPRFNYRNYVNVLRQPPPQLPHNWDFVNPLIVNVEPNFVFHGPVIGEANAIRPVSKYVQNLTEGAQEAAMAEATSSGLNVIKSDPYTFLLDIDTVRDRKQFDKGYALAKEIFPAWGWSYEEWESKSGNTHIKVSVPGAKHKSGSELSIMARLAIEMCLGSDRTRGLYGIAKILNMIGNPAAASVLFRPEAGPIKATEEGDEV